MSFELEILVVNQKDKVSLPFQSPITLKSEVEDGFGRLKNTWIFMSNTSGIWYSLGVEDDGWHTALPIIDTDFEEVAKSELPNWIEDENVLSNLTELSMVINYKGEVFKVIEHLINMSPIKTIMILARYQGGDTEIVQGVIPYNKFKSMLDGGKVLFNVCYIVRK
jgi:hypothetical protein